MGSVFFVVLDLISYLLGMVLVVMVLFAVWERFIRKDD